MTKCTGRSPRYLLFCLFFWLQVTLSEAFQVDLPGVSRPTPSPFPLPFTSTSALGLIPLTKFQDELSFFSSAYDGQRCCIDKDGTFTPKNITDVDTTEAPFEICIVEEADLAEVSLFIVKAFGADAISLSSNEFSAFEKGLMEPAMGFFNAYAGVTAFAEVLWGLRIRQTDRVLLDGSFLKKDKEKDTHSGSSVHAPVVNDISPPQLSSSEGQSYQEKVEVCNRKSLVLVLARQSTTDTANNASKWESVESNIDVIASVELRLQPCDAKIPFSLPWWDAWERKIARFFGIPKDPQSANHLQPYLSTLCVDDTYRGQQIGRAMVRCLEDIASTRWGYSKVYLHVDKDNSAALNLYKSEGYKDVGRRWNPFWAGKAADIGYYFKNLPSK